MTVLSGRILTILTITLLMASSPLVIITEELNFTPQNSDVGGRVTVDYFVETISFGNASHPTQNWTQPDKSISHFLIRGVEVDLGITIKQDAGSLGQFSTAYVLVEAYHPIGYLEWSESYTEYMTRGMRNTTHVKWTPESAHSQLVNGLLVGGYTIKVSISTGTFDTDTDSSNNVMETQIPTAIWRDELDDTSETATYFAMRAYKYSKNTADGPDAIGKGSWQLEADASAAVGTDSYRHSTPGNNYPGNAFDRLVWGFPTSGSSGCGEVLGVRSSNEGGWDGGGSYFWPWCRAKLDGSQFVSLDIATYAWGDIGAGDKVGLELWRAGAGNTQSLVKEIEGVSASNSQWSQIYWSVSDEEMNKLEWHLGFVFESDNSGATSGYHVDDFVIFAVENVSRFTLDVDCNEISSGEYPELGFSVIPDDPNPPGIECLIHNNGYKDAHVSVQSNNNNESWFSPRIDHSLSLTYGSEVFVIIPPDETASFWINQSIIPAAEVTNPSDMTLWNITVVGSFSLEQHYFTSIPISVGYHDNARIWSDVSSPAFSLFPDQSSIIDVQVQNTGNKNGKFSLTGAFPADRPQWLPWLSINYKDQFGIDIPRDNNNFQSVELTKGEIMDLKVELIAPENTFPGLFDVQLEINGIEGTSTQFKLPLSVEILTQYDLQMTTETQTLSSPADGFQEIIPVTLINNGNTLEVFDLQLLGDAWLLGATLSSTQTLPLEAYGLDPSGVNIILPMHEGIEPGDYTLILTATSINDFDYKGELYFTITVEDTRKVEVESRDLREQSYRGGQQEESITFQVNNTGNVEDQYVIELEVPFGMNAYVASIGMDGITTPSIQPGASFNVTVSFTFDTLAEGDFDLGVIAKSSFNENVKATGTAKYIVGNLGWIKLLLSSEIDVELDDEEPGKVYVLHVNEAGEYYLNLQVFNKHYTEQEIRIDFDDQISASYFGVQVDEYTSAFNIRDNDNENIALKVTIPKSTLLSLQSESLIVNLTVWVESDLDVAPLILKVELLRQSINPDVEEKSTNVGAIMLNGLSIVFLVGVLGALLFVLWREFSKEDEEELYGYDSGITSQVGEDGRSVPSANMIFGTTGESEGVVKTIPDLPDETPSEVVSEESIMPPLPETGLPEGWTMEQWQHYGEQWLNQQK